MRTIHTYMRYSHTHTNGWKNRESYWSGQNRILLFLKLLWDITSTILAIWRLFCLRVYLIFWKSCYLSKSKSNLFLGHFKISFCFSKDGHQKTSTDVRRCKQGTGIINGMGKYSIFIFECLELYPKYSLTATQLIYIRSTNFVPGIDLFQSPESFKISWYEISATWKNHQVLYTDVLIRKYDIGKLSCVNQNITLIGTNLIRYIYSDIFGCWTFLSQTWLMASLTKSEITTVSRNLKRLWTLK